MTAISRAEFASSPDNALKMATTHMVRWLVNEYQLEPWAARLLIGCHARYDVVPVMGSMALKDSEEIPAAATVKLARNQLHLALEMVSRLIAAACLLLGPIFAQTRPGLFFREDWAETPAATPLTQEHVSNKDLVVTLYGPGRDQIKKSHHDQPADDPYYVWSGEATGNWAVSLRHRRAYADLTGQGKIRWRAKQEGYRQLRIILKLADGTWLVGDQADGASADWRERELNVSDLRWRRLDVQKVVEGAWVEKPDLRKVDEVGFTDLMIGGGSPACSRLDWIEVWGKPVPR